MTLGYLKQVVEKVHVGVVICNNDKEIIVWNKKAEEIIGIDSKVLPKEKWLTYFNVFDINGNIIPGEQYPLMKASNGITTTGEKIIVKNEKIPDGVICAMDSFPIYNEDGTVCGGAVVFHDITEDIRIQKFLEELSVRFEHMKKFIKEHINVSYPLIAA